MKLSHNNSGQRQFSFAHRLNSFRYAWSGLKAVLKNEHNTWIHLFLSIASVASGIFFKISKSEWMALVLVIAMVWAAEIFNTCIEKIMDFLSTDNHPQIKIIKDMAAAAVMITSIAAILVGCIIFIPKIL